MDWSQSWAIRTKLNCWVWFCACGHCSPYQARTGRNPVMQTSPNTRWRHDEQLAVIWHADVEIRACQIAGCARPYVNHESICSWSQMWWRSCDYAKVGMRFECAAGEPSVGCDMRWMWLIVLLLLRTLFRLPSGPFRSIHCLFVPLLINFTACAETYWEPKQLLYWWISLLRCRAPCQTHYFSLG